MLAVNGKRPGQGFKIGLILGITIFLKSAYWLYYPVVNYSGLPWLLSVLLLVVLFILLGSVYGLWAWLYLYFDQNANNSPFWLALSWTAVEYLRYRLIPDMGFAYLGYTQVKFPHFLQAAELGGLFLLSFLVVLINGYFARFFFKKKVRYIVPVILLLLAVIIYGNLRLGYYQQPDGQKLAIGLVQTNLTPELKWEISRIETNMDYLLSHSQQLKDAELIVWPESSLTFDLIRNGYYRDLFWQNLAGLPSYLQTGSLAIKEGEEEYRRYNSSFLISPELKIAGRYNKIRLVPFGEYLPIGRLLTSFFGLQLSDQKAGQEAVLFSSPFASWKTLICSEILHPVLMKMEIEQADFVVNQSNETWCRQGNLQEQMWTAAVFRAVENRRTIIKAGNYAYGGIILPSGQELSKVFSREKTVITGQIPLSREKTLYQKWGDWVGYLSLGIMGLLLLLKRLFHHFTSIF